MNLKKSIDTSWMNPNTNCWVQDNQGNDPFFKAIILQLNGLNV
jgi:hypothetical protein